MTNAEAYRLLEEALERVTTQNRQTDEVHAALRHLARQSREQWPFHQFWRALPVPEEELAFMREGRRQTARSALNGIRLRVREPLSP